MDTVFLLIIVFLFLLAVFDLSVGVSNDAVNFLNSAIGSKAASFKRVIIVAAVGVFIGAVMSNGMMDVARHGIFRPENFSFYDLICIFMAVMVTDIILLDIFNTLGMPTSTTVSMVFELLGATFAVSLIKMTGDETGLTFNDLLNTEKALSVIIGIFLSVAIAFVSGAVVQFVSRILFTFSYKDHLKWKIGIFGGIAITAIIYFLIIKGAGSLTFMTPDIKAWINANTFGIISVCLVVSTILMQLLHLCRVNVFKVVVLTGTFALAMAFAGNDLVNFIGVPLSGFSSYQDYMANGAGNARTFMMGSLNGPAATPLYFLFGAGVIMVIALSTSRKARRVVSTSVNLARQDGGEEMFGSSRIARRLVRWSLNVAECIERMLPTKVKAWIGKRFDTDGVILENGAAFDLVRGSVNLVLAGMLIALGTSLKLPLSTTYVTFMVAMGSSLADRAWGRESAVFRITGVISVIGGWFITAGVAFIGAAVIVALMHWGGMAVTAVAGILSMALLVRNSVRSRRKVSEDKDDTLFRSMLTTDDKGQVWDLLQIYLADQQKTFAGWAKSTYGDIARGFVKDDTGALGSAERMLMKEKQVLKNNRRKVTLCLRRINRETAIEKNTWIFLSNNCCMSMVYNLWRINEVCKEHVDNNFRRLPEYFAGDLSALIGDTDRLFDDSAELIGRPDHDATQALRRRCDKMKDDISEKCRLVTVHLQEGSTDNLAVYYVYLNLLQETGEMVSGLRKLLGAADNIYRPSHAISRHPVGSLH